METSHVANDAGGRRVTMLCLAAGTKADACWDAAQRAVEQIPQSQDAGFLGYTCQGSTPVNGSEEWSGVTPGV